METVLIDGGTITVLPETTHAMNVHDASQCNGRTCIIHNPTDHQMRSWPLHWRSDRGIFERICPHRIGHPDPDQQAYWHEQGHQDFLATLSEADPADLPLDHGGHVADYISGQMTHGCDGCCAP